ncbi:hypothetical protein GYMLUDRAFT_43977 [Collybiopsis luxurians FD-317 M1]|uniref:Major facilitator superfamily (MFS) profile domain-containing protein n=1 Tax=Collybiopsis luxurians FD-317 M1 TaxID=944289 RepID=A0A0D0CNE1_9AGAR|nr:hypothetical protein GYMLUDRAFT_43977 [Collybiopsis luxurians FD-317 M1]
MQTPLPKRQIFLTLLIQLSEPITAMVIYPFIIKAVRRTGITRGDEKKTGYYAGVIESLFFISESLSVYHIGRASDFYGRKPVLLIGPLGLSIAMLIFGLSKSFWGMVVARTLMGVFNGNIGVSKTVMAESTDETNRADAFTLMPLVWTIGTVVGPALGGILADPATTWPHIFGKISFFKEYPWFLPCFAAGLLAFVAFLLSSWGLKETLATKVTEKKSKSKSSPSLLLNDAEATPSYGSIQNEPTTTTPLLSTQAQTQTPPTTLSLLRDPHLRITLLSMGFLAFTDMSYMALLPLIYSTSIPLGGLGFSPYQIGLIMGTFGLFNGIWNWAVLTRFLKKAGPRKTLIVCYSLFVVHFSLLWVLREVAGWLGEVTPLVWGVLVVQLFVSTATYTAFNAIYLMIVMNAPPNALGSVNGLAQMVSSGTRGFAPVFASSLFSYSLESRMVRGHLVEVVLMGVTLLGVWCMVRLPKSR